jgi:hypothetical protein
MKPATIFHLESKDGKFIDSIFSPEDLNNVIKEDPSGIGNISTFSKDQFSITDIQSQLQSVSHLMNAGIYAIDGSPKGNLPDRIFSLIELINSAEKILHDAKLNLSYNLDFEYIFDTGKE